MSTYKQLFALAKKLVIKSVYLIQFVWCNIEENLGNAWCGLE